MQNEKYGDEQPTGMSVEALFSQNQETFEEAQQRSIEESKTFARTEFFRMDKLGTYRLRAMLIAPDAERKGYEYPVRQLLLEIEKPSSGNKTSSLYVTVPRATDAGYPVDMIDTYRKLAVEAANDKDDEKLAEKIKGGSFGGGLKYNYAHAMYVLDMNERAKGLQLLMLSHSQFKELDERKLKLWSKKRQKDPSYPCPISSYQNAYPIEIEKKKNGQKTEYVISIDNEDDPDVLSVEELNALMAAPRLPEVIYRYSRYQYGATLEFLKQCDEKYGLSIMDMEEMQEAIETLEAALPKDDTSAFSFDKRTKDAKDNTGTGISFDDVLNMYDELQEKGLGDKTEEGQELRALIRSFIEQEKLPVKVTRSTTNATLIDMIEQILNDPDGASTQEDEEDPTPSRTRRN